MKKKTLNHLNTPAGPDPILDEVMALDVAYFAQNPGETTYMRPYVPGEFGAGPLDPIVERSLENAIAIKVTLFPNGQRGREPYHDRFTPDGNLIFAQVRVPPGFAGFLARHGINEKDLPCDPYVRDRDDIPPLRG